MQEWHSWQLSKAQAKQATRGRYSNTSSTRIDRHSNICLVSEDVISEVIPARKSLKSFLRRSSKKVAMAPLQLLGCDADGKFVIGEEEGEGGEMGRPLDSHRSDVIHHSSRSQNFALTWASHSDTFPPTR